MSAHLTHQMHVNSVRAHRSLPDLSDRKARVIAVLSASSLPLTDRQIAAALGHSDAGYVRPRVTELVDAGTLVEIGTTRDETTGRSVRMVMTAARAAQ